METEKFALDISEDCAFLALPPVLDIRASAPLKNSFAEVLALGKPLVMDASKAETLSTPCIQVILSATRELEKGDITFSLTPPSDAFVDAFDDLGLFSVLMKWKIES